MTPKEKALELSIKFCSPSDVFKPNIGSKRQALICVNEIISICPYQNYKETLCPYDGAELSVDYWEEVKQEIELL
jgi:hypothetical protein